MNNRSSSDSSTPRRRQASTTDSTLARSESTSVPSMSNRKAAGASGTDLSGALITRRLLPGRRRTRPVAGSGTARRCGIAASRHARGQSWGNGQKIDRGVQTELLDVMKDYPPRFKPKHYQPFWCEENIWHLAQDPATVGDPAVK